MKFHMNPLYPDKRKAIAGEFFISDSRIKNRSRKAYKKIQTYKECKQVPNGDLTYNRQVENLVRYSFFQTISTAFILLQERYYEKPNDN